MEKSRRAVLSRLEFNVSLRTMHMLEHEEMEYVGFSSGSTEMNVVRSAIERDTTRIDELAHLWVEMGYTRQTFSIEAKRFEQEYRDLYSGEYEHMKAEAV